MCNLADHDRARHALARQVLDEAERRGLRVWQQFGAAYIARPVRGRLLPAPKHWQRVVEALSYEIACLLDWDCGWGCTVERVPGGKCLVYRPQRWAIRGDTGAAFDALDTAPVAGDVAGRSMRPIAVERSG
jgi:hypothetical protein